MWHRGPWRVLSSSKHASNKDERFGERLNKNELVKKKNTIDLGGRGRSVKQEKSKPKNPPGECFPGEF